MTIKIFVIFQVFAAAFNIEARGAFGAFAASIASIYFLSLFFSLAILTAA
jgi:hypothetical protein